MQLRENGDIIKILTNKNAGFMPIKWMVSSYFHGLFCGLCHPSPSFWTFSAPEFLQLLNPLQVLKVVGGERKLFQEGTDLGGRGESL